MPSMCHVACNSLYNMHIMIHLSVSPEARNAHDSHITYVAYSTDNTALIIV